MKHLIVMLFALSLIGCGGGGGGGGNDNGGDGAPQNRIVLPTLVQLNDYNIKLENEDVNGDGHFQNHNFKFSIVDSDVDAEISEDARFGTTTNKIPLTAENILNFANVESQNSFDLELPDGLRTLNIKTGNMPLLYTGTTDNPSLKYRVPVVMTSGDTLNGLPAGIHYYGGESNYSTRGPRRSNTNGQWHVQTSEYNAQTPVQSGLISVSANFDTMTGSIDNRTWFANGIRTTISDNPISYEALTGVEITGDFNINTDGSFAGTGNLKWNKYITNISSRTIDIDSDTTITGNFHGNQAAGVSGIFYTNWENYTVDVNKEVPYRFTGAFIAGKRE